MLFKTLFFFTEEHGDIYSMFLSKFCYHLIWEMNPGLLVLWKGSSAHSKS